MKTGRFVKVNNTLISINRLLAVQHKPAKSEGSFVSAEHYLAVFDTGQELRLTVQDGATLLKANGGSFLIHLKGLLRRLQVWRYRCIESAHR